MFQRSFLLILILSTFTFAQNSYINHQITAYVDPENHYIEATDKITIPADQLKREMYFLMVSDLKVISETADVLIELDKTKIKAKDFGMDQEDFEKSSSITQNKYKVIFKKDLSTFTLKFSGRIHYAIKEMGEEYARGFSQSPGIISDEGVYLGGSTYWVPWFNDRLITFELTTTLPENWDAVSQGNRTLHEKKAGKQITTWDSPEPMEEIYLIAAKFNEYIYPVGAVDVMAFLRTPDENLANKYLQTTAQYLEMYRNLVGPYPFSKFALVENFWETGYGMPSFTLLGQQVIRFPFILHSSYPHELLHNWWGNSAYVDFETGNWCEGITVYMADHLIKEQRSQGLQYRRSTLQKFTDYVTPDTDFPLKNFLSRHNAASEAIGYGKCMMMYNMLREEVGDKQFIKGFQKFYRDNKYKFASFDDIRKSFESVTNKNYKPFFQQWVERTGAPELNLSDVKVNKYKNKYRLEFHLQQVQKDEVYSLNVPVAVSFKNKTEIKKVSMDKMKQSFEMTFSEKPLQVQIDPQFNLFRKLHYNEIPPSLSKIFGSKELLILLPSKAEHEQLKIYKRLADIWSKDKTKKITVLFDNEVKKMPADKAVWLFGKENIHGKLIQKGIKDYDAEIGNESIRLGKTINKFDNNSFVISVRHPNNVSSVLVMLTVGNKNAVPGLARKLLHYGKYSYLTFEGSEPTNIAKGQWKSVNSPLTVSLIKIGGQPLTVELPKREPLAKLAPLFSAERMLDYVKYLSSDELEGRGLGSAGIEKAADFIVEKFKAAGLKPGGESDSYFHTWNDVIDEKGNKGQITNIIGFIPGKKKEFAGESVVVCAHYDHLGLGWPDVRKGNEGKIHHGADDNASGVAVMLELADLLGKGFEPDRTVIFVAFTAEENGLMGSKYYVKNMKQYPVNKVIGVLNLDTVGRLGKNKLLVLNSNSAREWKFIFMGTGYVTGVEAEMVTQDLDASDQLSFIEAGAPGVQFFSGPNRDYHRPSDTFEKIDGDGMVKVATFVRETIIYLSEREEPLTFMGRSEKEPKNVKRGGRRVSTGTMPDFSFSGEGVKIANVSDGSPADKAGLQKGDVIIKLGEMTVANLRDYSNALKTHNPGDEVTIVYLHDGEEITSTIKLEAR